ncbi:MAG: hypothetical protein U0361_20225 [Nitrospiraceae bacterium]
MGGGTDPERLRFSSRLAIKLVALFILIVAFVLDQTVPSPDGFPPTPRSSGRRIGPSHRPHQKWHIFEGVRVKQGDIILELDDYDPSFMAPDLLSLLDQRKQALTDAARQRRVVPTNSTDASKCRIS